MDKVSVTFVTADGESETVQAPIGISLMQAARFHSQNEYVMGIEADCMGCQSCAPRRGLVCCNPLAPRRV